MLGGSILNKRENFGGNIEARIDVQEKGLLQRSDQGVIAKLQHVQVIVVVKSDQQLSDAVVAPQIGHRIVDQVLIIEVVHLVPGKVNFEDESY